METILKNGFNKVLNGVRVKFENITLESDLQWANDLAELREKHGDNTPEFKQALHDKRVAEADEVLETLNGVDLAKRMLLMFINLDERYSARFAYDGHLLVVEIMGYGVALTAYNKNGGFKSIYFNACELENDFEKAGAKIEKTCAKANIN